MSRGKKSTRSSVWKFLSKNRLYGRKLRESSFFFLISLHLSRSRYLRSLARQLAASRHSSLKIYSSACFPALMIRFWSRSWEILSGRKKREPMCVHMEQFTLSIASTWDTGKKIGIQPIIQNPRIHSEEKALIGYLSRSSEPHLVARRIGRGVGSASVA